MDADALLRHAMGIAAEADVTSPPDRLVLFTISYQPTKANKEAVIRFRAANPGFVMMDDTEAGRLLDALDLFGPNSPVAFEQAYEPWFVASRRLIAGASGNVTTFVSDADPRSTFVRIELPELVRNPRVVTLDGVPKAEWVEAFARIVPPSGAPAPAPVA